MIKVSKLIKDMVYIVQKRKTAYSNEYPYNCGYIHSNGTLSFDCIGLWKSYINNPEIAYKTSPVGYYVQPGTVVPDGYGERELLSICTNVTWGNFSNAVQGEYMYMSGHAGIFVGDAFGKNSNVNVIECTMGWGVNRVCASWVDADGTRRDMKGGTPLGKWEAHGKMTPYIDYSADKKEEKSVFKDVPTTNKNYKYYKAIVDAGIMRTDAEGNFKPKKHITRGALAVVLYRLMKKAKLIK